VSFFYPSPGKPLTHGAVHDPDKPPTGDAVEDDIVSIGRRINELWVLSKQGGTGLPEWEDEYHLHDALRRETARKPVEQALWPSVLSYMNWVKNVLLGNLLEQEGYDPLVPSRNSMNLILPAYEAMWRVAIKCFLGNMASGHGKLS
jgi:hypothetical protein